jgi:hypothetical protein
MPADALRTRVGGPFVVVGVVLSSGYAVAVASTTPFTWWANAMTAIPIAAVAIAAAVRWPARPDRSPALVGDGGPRPRHPYLGWVVLSAAVVGWELAEYLWRGSRSAHPTLSSMADAVDAHAAGKAVACFAWLWLGAAIVRAGTPVRVSARAES